MIVFIQIISAVLIFNFFSACKTEKPIPSGSIAKSGIAERMITATPPMGWNSFDAYDYTINEEQFRATVDFMAENLLKYGWKYAVIDYIWWHPGHGKPGGTLIFKDPNLQYKSNGGPLHPEYITMDEYGRLLPAVQRFPSAKNGKGFKPIADYVHSKGLKFGLHIMRGIPRAAYFYDTPVKGTVYSAQDIGEPADTCQWLNHMFGVDPTKPGAREYYNSIFDLYAQWGVDYIKVDDILDPVFHQGEIKLIRDAIERCGRPMVLSLSPGEAPLSRAKFLEKYANLWRISNDFWDTWGKLRHNFDLLNAWSSYIQPNHWPDADMLPIGHISLGGRPHGPDRMSRFTWPEHYTLITLWCIARSPLMMGGDLLTSSEKSLSFLKNSEALEVNQNSLNNRQIYKRNKSACWMADIPGRRDKYLALFNLDGEKKKVNFNFEWEMLRGGYKVRDLWVHKELGTFKEDFGAVLEAHGAGLYKLSPVTNESGPFRGN